MWKTIKFILTLALWWILWIWIQSLWLLFLVNNWFTNEKGDIWNQVKLWSNTSNEISLTLTWSENNYNIWNTNTWSNVNQNDIDSKPIDKLQILIQLRDKDWIWELEMVKSQLDQYILQKKMIEKKKEGIALCILSEIRDKDTIIGDLMIKEYKDKGFDGLNEKFGILWGFLSNMWKDNKFIEKCSTSKMTIDEFNSIKDKQKETTWYLGTLSKNQSFIYIMDFFTNEDESKSLDNVVSILWDNVLKEEILSIVSSEQVRASNTYRWLFKSVMKNNMLQSYTQFSLWISGIKENTAIKIESDLKNPKSEFYLWKEYETLLDFKTKNIKQERIDRLTNQNDYYWQYLYTWIFIKMVKHQWEANWHLLWDNHIWIISTLFNIWINKSEPKETPNLWGASIKVDGQVFLFWEISEISYLYQKLK